MSMRAEGQDMETGDDDAGCARTRPIKDTRHRLIRNLDSFVHRLFTALHRPRTGGDPLNNHPST